MDHASEQKDFSKPLTFQPLSPEAETRRLITEERPQRMRIFKNDFLESLTLVRWQSIFKFWPPVIIALIYWGNHQYSLSFATNFVLIFSGILFWSLAEYLIHRFPFHWSPDTEWGKQLVYSMHGNHHEDPFDPLRGVMPIVPAIIYVSILYGLFSLVVPAQFFNVFFGGFLIGYLCYDGIHYYTHHAKPKNKVGKYLRRVHLVHHVHSDMMYGISSPLWDLIFGTYIKQDTKIAKEF
jgi:sterol desaturase/sphingolipid hydroxylase (fatty acid hydroxylase superfamily)